MPVAEPVVTLRFPASTERVRLARTLVAVLGDESGFDYEQVEDLRIGVDELCFALLDRCDPTATIEIRADAQPGVLRVEGVVEGATSPAEEVTPLAEITRQILATVVDSYELVLDDDAPRFTFVKQKP